MTARPLQHRDRAALIGLVGCRVRRRSRPARGRGGVAQHRGFGEVAGELGERGVGRVAVHGEDRVTERSMEPRPSGNRELAGERVAHDGMGEGEASRTGLDQEASADRVVEAVDDRVGGSRVGHRTQHPYTELEPFQRRDREGLVRGRRQP
jgi:hypothetical protein